MSVSAWLLIIQSVIYLGAAVAALFEASPWKALMLLCYGVANYAVVKGMT